MKKWLATGAALLMATSIASAGVSSGINLAWDDCGSNGESTLTFACDANTGAPLTLVASFVPPADINEFIGIVAQIDFNVAPQLPDWWKHGVAFCRGTNALAASVDFTSAPFSCLDFYNGLATSGIAYEEFGSPDRARLRIEASVPFKDRGPVLAGMQYYAFKINILKTKTTGSGACAGCFNEACIVLNSLKLVQPVEVANDPILTTGVNQNWVTYQSLSILDCPANTPVRNTTWGRVKSLYR